MDKFENTMAMLAKMHPAEKTKPIEEMKEKCICFSCPTYNDCAENAKEFSFVARWKLVCISDEKIVSARFAQ